MPKPNIASRRYLICEPLSDAFLAEFRKLGFKLALPRERMTVITLKNKASYDAYCGVVAGDEVGGHFDLETNRLVVFDFRSKRAELAATAERVNTFTLVHEGMHLLSYNSGLLDRKQDVPAAIAEGLATYGELWRPKGRGKIGHRQSAQAQGFDRRRECRRSLDPDRRSTGRRRFLSKGRNGPARLRRELAAG